MDTSELWILKLLYFLWLYCNFNIHQAYKQQSTCPRMKGSKIQELLREKENRDRLTAVRRSLVEHVMVVQSVDLTLFRLVENCFCHSTKLIGLLLSDLAL